MPNNPVSCRVPSYGEFESIAFEHLASLGVQYVELVAPTLAEAAGVKAQLDKHGLRAATIHGQCDVASDECAAQVKAQMPVLETFGAKLMFVSCKAGETPLDAVYGRLRDAGAAAAEHGVTIVMETHPDLITNGDVARRTIESVNHPNVRVNFDTANVMFYNEGVDSVDELRKVVDYVAAVHLKETNGKYRTWCFPALGRGVVDFPRLFQLLDAHGFDGPLTMEIEGIEGETPTERRTCDRIAESVGYLRALGRL